MMSVAIRFARAVNRALGRKGRVIEDRYHVRVLGTPRLPGPRPRTWLLREGWRRRGLLDPGDVPGAV